MNKRQQYEDDGRTIADMSAEWMPWNRGIFRKNRGERKAAVQSKEEKKQAKQEYRMAVWAMYRAMLPQILCIIAAFGLVFLLLKLWFS